jgi:hypothetical protein
MDTLTILKSSYHVNMYEHIILCHINKYNYLSIKNKNFQIFKSKPPLVLVMLK